MAQQPINQLLRRSAVTQTTPAKSRPIPPSVQKYLQSLGYPNYPKRLGAQRIRRAIQPKSGYYCEDCYGTGEGYFTGQTYCGCDEGAILMIVSNKLTAPTRRSIKRWKQIRKTTNKRINAYSNALSVNTRSKLHKPRPSQRTSSQIGSNKPAKKVGSLSRRPGSGQASYGSSKGPSLTVSQKKPSSKKGPNHH